MMCFADVVQGRDNHFNLIRMLAALAVLVSHAWLLVGGTGAIEPMQDVTGHSLGTLAVFVFFAISGYFITASFDRAPRWQDFVMARLRRLFPALIVSVLLVALVMGPLVTTLPIGDYLTQSQTWSFILRNITLLLAFVLPGVFETNPIPIVAGSIWTLPNEVACYLGVFGVGMLGLIRRPQVLAALLGLWIVFWAMAETGLITLHPRIEGWRVLALPFVIGMLLYLGRRIVPFSGLLAGGLTVALVAATPLIGGSMPYDLLLAVTLAYVTFWAAYLPWPGLRAYNRLGDYSYGTYLYAFPLQGLMLWLFGTMSPWMNIALTLPPTLLLAVASWHLIEAPALRVKPKGAAQV